MNLAVPAFGDQPPLTFDRIDFGVDASRQVENDTLIAIMYFQREGEVAEQLADTVNQNIQWGLEKAHKVQGLKIQTLDYYTNPVYRNQKLQGWRVSQSIRLESRDSAQLSQLVGRLQERLAVRSIDYEVSPQRRRLVENELIGEAMGNFAKRADLITKQLGRSAYRLVQMQIRTTGSAPIPRQRRMMAMKAEAAAAPPSLEAGTQTLSLNVSGTIELKLD